VSENRYADVLIVGAGPVGLTLANDLVGRGTSCRVIDQLAEPTRRSKAHGMQSRTLEALDTIGLAEPIMAAAQHPQPPFLIFSGERQIARIDFASFLHTPYPYQLVIWQQRIERVLETELERRGLQVERAARLLSFEMKDDGVTATVDRGNGNSDTIHSKWIVGCDGGGSTVRHILDLPMQGTTMPGCFWLGEFDIDWSRSRETMYEWWHTDGMVATDYIDFTNKWHVFIELLEDSKGEPTLAKMSALFRERTGDNHATLSNPDWIDTLKVNQRMPAHFIVGRAILAGDAAHVHSAAGGQGMNTGMQDALNLGWKLALTMSGAASDTLLQTYESERLPNARAVPRTSQTYHQIEIPHGVIGRWIGGEIFRAIQSIRSFGDAALAQAGMLNVNYEGSPLSVEHWRPKMRQSRAGWHIPDAPCKRNGRAESLFDILRGPTANLLLFAGSNPRDETIASLRQADKRLGALKSHVRTDFIFASEFDADRARLSGVSPIIDGGQHLQTALDLSKPELIYVRPDGYIGLRCQNLQNHCLDEYLKRVYRAR
jgi:2-polyprenyl-6-methoxyphenol hydroxylase-like FAD-dependent oxidoreductase